MAKLDVKKLAEQDLKEEKYGLGFLEILKTFGKNFK